MVPRGDDGPASVDDDDDDDADGDDGLASVDDDDDNDGDGDDGPASVDDDDDDGGDGQASVEVYLYKDWTFRFWQRKTRGGGARIEERRKWVSGEAEADFVPEADDDDGW